jgi:hypothetical protein
MHCGKALLGAGLSVVAVLLLTACGGVGRPTSPPPPSQGPTTTGPITGSATDKSQVVTPEELVTDLSDGQQETFRRWQGNGKELQIRGVVSVQIAPMVGTNKQLTAVQFTVPITNKKTGKKETYTLEFRLAKSLPLEDANISKYAVGKTVTLRGKLNSLSAGAVSVYDCELVE